MIENGKQVRTKTFTGPEGQAGLVVRSEAALHDGSRTYSVAFALDAGTEQACNIVVVDFFEHQLEVVR